MALISDKYNNDILVYLFQDDYCLTALCVACQVGHAKIVTTLINCGADINYQSKVVYAVAMLLTYLL